MPSDQRWGAAVALLLAFSAGASAAGPPTPPPTFDRDVRPLLGAFCVRCHGKTKPRGGVDLASLSGEKALPQQYKLWQRVVAQVRAGEMPPARQPQPTQAQRNRLGGWLAHALRSADGTDPGPALARRLTRTEYERTLRDLVGIDFHSGEAVGMPDDAEGSGFDNLARGLTLSQAQMEKYFAAADKVLERILGRPDGKPAGGSFDRNQAQRAARALLFVTPSEKRPARAAARNVIARFARRAYRRPVEEREIDRLMRLYDLARKKGDGHENGLRLMLKAVLVSPHFLLRVEQDRGSVPGRGYPVGDHELASRLSYFLWSTMPDEALMKLADDGKLSDPAVLEQQVGRMLAAPRARALTDYFGVPWLQVRKVWHARPSQEFFPGFSHALRGAMYDEVVTFFDRLRQDNRSVLELLDADYTYANETLARHYGLAGVKGDAMRRVALKPTDRRGGLLGMAGILTMTSHTSRTSPTLRGKWVLEVVFGTPPAPPPPDAGMLKEEKEKGKAARTFRELMAAHATQASCAACHRKMDPLGYALDNFDAIGRWRESDGARPLDTTGVLPGGERLNGAGDLKRIILKRKGDFVRTLVEQMLVYALGRELQHFDEPTVREVTAALARDDYRFAALVRAIIKSYPFRHRRNGGDE